MADFTGKTVVVTGGAQGMGRDTAVAFAAAGARVVIADIDEVAGATAVEAVLAAGKDVGGEAEFVAADVARNADCARVAARAARDGGIDILFNNVGIQPADSYATVEETDEETWDRILAVNLKSYFLMAKHCIPHIRARGGGAIINNASVQGLQSAPGVPAYAASKGGVLSLTRQLAVDYAREGIRVLAICPGTIDTEMVRSAVRAEGGDIDAALREFGARHPMGRVGTGREIASVVLFLASAGASFMTGEYVCVDGGMMALGAWAGEPESRST